MALRYEIENSSEKLVHRALRANLFLYAVGYERRSAFFRDQLPDLFPPAFAMNYNSQGVGSFDLNRSACEARGDSVVGSSKAEIESALKERLVESKFGGRPVQVSIDVTCLDRTVMATVFLSLSKLLSPGDVVDVLYAPAEFQPPQLFLPPLKSFKPAIPELSSPVGNPYERRFLLLGLGYEYGAALNVLNTIEPDRSHLLVPVGNDPRYLEAVAKANFQFDFGVGNFTTSTYRLEDPEDLHATVRDIVMSYKHYGSVTIVPFGPKLLSAVCLLLAISNRSFVTFMRYSVESRDLFSDVKASGAINGFTLNFT